MPGPRPQSLKLKRQHRVILQQLTRRRKTPRGLSQRAQIILLADLACFIHEPKNKAQKSRNMYPDFSFV